MSPVQEEYDRCERCDRRQYRWEACECLLDLEPNEPDTIAEYLMLR